MLIKDYFLMNFINREVIIEERYRKKRLNE